MSHLSWFRLCTRQRFINQVYTNTRTNVEKITIIFLKCSNVQRNADSQEEKTNTDENTIYHTENGEKTNTLGKD